MHHLTISGFEGGPSLANVQAGLALCPRPRDISFLEGSLRFSPSISLDVSGAGSWYLLDHLNEELQAYGVNTVKKGTVTTAPGPILEQMIADHDIDSVEGFSLETTTDQLIIVSKGDAGLFYGIQLLYQLLHVDGGSCAIPRVKVKDFPRMSIRGLSQDISRGQSPSVDAIKRHVKIMSRFRLNLYQFYMEDMFESKAYPQIGKGRGPLTPQAVKELEEFAKHYHVEIMPIYQNLSHMENVLLDPEIGRLAEFPGAGCLNMADPKIYEFLAKVLGEVACAFSSGKFHIGCDESWDVGMGKSKDFIEHKGMAKALLDHYTWVIKTLKEHGKRQFFLYHDIASKYDEVLAGLPKDDVVMVFWEYSVKDEWKEIDRIASFGVKFVVSSSVLSWTLPFPELARSFLSNRKLIDNGLRKGAIGQINSAWGDNGQENFHENNLMGFSYSAAYSWNPDGCDDATFWKAYARAAFGTDDARIPRLFEALNRIHADFPRRYISKWLGFLWRHPYHSPALDNVHPLFPEEMLMEVSDELVYHEDDMEKQRPLCKEIVSLARECKASTRRNKEGLDYYEFIGNMLEYFINKIQTTAKVTNLLKDGVHPGDAAKVRSLIEPVISQLVHVEQ